MGKGEFSVVVEMRPCQKSYIVIEKINKIKIFMVTKKMETIVHSKIKKTTICCFRLVIFKKT
jgi:hypothetical protein